MSTDNLNEVTTIEEEIKAEGGRTAGFLVAFTLESMELSLTLLGAALRQESEAELAPWKVVARTGAAFLEALTDLREQMISEPDDDEVEHDEPEVDADMVSTNYQLDALPLCTVVLAADGTVFQCKSAPGGRWWFEPGLSSGVAGVEVALPARVLDLTTEAASE